MHLESYSCVLCQESVEETTQHLFLDCQFSNDYCWNSIGVTFQANTEIMEAINQIRDQTHPSFFMAIAILMCWSIWSVRNNFIFKGIQPNTNAVKEIFQKELKVLWASLSLTFDLWLENFLQEPRLVYSFSFLFWFLNCTWTPLLFCFFLIKSPVGALEPLQFPLKKNSHTPIYHLADHARS